MQIGTFAFCAFWLIAQPAIAATPSDFTDCGSNDLDRQIAGCSHIIEERLLPAETLARAHHFRGLAREHKGEFAEALADYNEAIRLGPEVATVYWWRPAKCSACSTPFAGSWRPEYGYRSRFAPRATVADPPRAAAKSMWLEEIVVAATKKDFMRTHVFECSGRAQFGEHDVSIDEGSARGDWLVC